MSLQQALELITEHAGWFVAASVSSFVLGIAFGPLLILRLPADYFTYRRRDAVAKTRRHPLVHLLLAGMKNVAGAALVIAGLGLLVLPGQGIITLLAGLVIANYPGKFRLERWLVRRPHVLPGLNWLRNRCGYEILLAPDDPGPQAKGIDSSIAP